MPMNVLVSKAVSAWEMAGKSPAYNKNIFQNHRENSIIFLGE
jgi:hypothetical protein